ncbi:MAG: 2-C-methyl-D-erythritol 2,4-cyclodiphosphate synthase [Tenericutes bacterium ADurb.BinA155]|jgi:2-C-methyl-D-erythritol 2,4-cyclodiphosphate synthase|nr:MAG: 2-C-methyl-D-erythritol 2,4-cyclodiphosphate synthase [Tenericutes bacterium ADurb.BinA155]
MEKFRIGYGEDIHQLVINRDLILAGVKIPYEMGLLGHSDADVVYHAASDAILGALALGDIGKYFPTHDRKWENADSATIVQGVVTMMQEQNYSVNNLDVSISCEKPLLAPYIGTMRQNLADLLQVDVSAISVKAMTNEGLDAVGAGKAIRASAVVLLVSEVEQSNPGDEDQE